MVFALSFPFMFTDNPAAALPVFIVIVFVGIFMYCLPLGIALYRQHRQAAPIAIINLLLGWTVIGWIVTLAWAFGDNRKRESIHPA